MQQTDNTSTSEPTYITAKWVQKKKEELFLQLNW